jgi:hypothetical protein
VGKRWTNSVESCLPQDRPPPRETLRRPRIRRCQQPMRQRVGSVGRRGQRPFPTLEGLRDHRTGRAQAANRAFLGAAHRGGTPCALGVTAPEPACRMIVFADCFRSAAPSSVGCCKFADSLTSRRTLTQVPQADHRQHSEPFRPRSCRDGTKIGKQLRVGARRDLHHNAQRRHLKRPSARTRARSQKPAPPASTP